MSDEQKVRAVYPNATFYGYGHGKVRIESGGKVLSDMFCTGTREARRERAWADAASRLEPMTSAQPQIEFTGEKRMEATQRFHEHLDKCRQCNEQPFNLCAAGATLATAAAKELASTCGTSFIHALEASAPPDETTGKQPSPFTELRQKVAASGPATSRVSEEPKNRQFRLEAVLMIVDDVYEHEYDEPTRTILAENLARWQGGMISLVPKALEMAEELLALRESHAALVVENKQLQAGVIQSGNWKFRGKTPQELTKLIYGEARAKELQPAPAQPEMTMTIEQKLEKAFDMLHEVEEAPSSDPTWFDKVFELTGEHMILTDEGWQPGDLKGELVAEYGEDAVLREVNPPHEEHGSLEGEVMEAQPLPRRI